MERLTYYESGYARYDFNGVQYQNEVATRLAAYEDTGLEPEEVADLKCAWDMYGGEDGITEALKELARYKESEADGRLVVPPCKAKEPYGRLIDADALKYRVTKRLYAAKHGSIVEAYYGAVIGLLDAAPAIVLEDEPTDGVEE